MSTAAQWNICARHGNSAMVGIFGDQAMARHLALMFVRDIGGVVVEGRESPHHAHHHRHGMRVAPEAAEQKVDLFMYHRVEGYGVVEFRHGLGRGKFPVEQQIADFEERGIRRQLVDRVAAIEQYPLVAVDEGDVAFARGGGGESRIVCEKIRVAIKLADIDDVGTLGRLIDREVDASVPISERCCPVLLDAARVPAHVRTP